MNKLQLWKEKGLTLNDRLQTKPAVRRDGIEESTLERKKERGDIAQNIRLRFYPSIRVDFGDLYAGTFEGTLQEFEDEVFDIGYRNNPTAYVEITERFGPDDGSYARQVVTEDEEFPYLGIGRPLGHITYWNRIKLQNHITVYAEPEKKWVHILAHREASAWLQPARHLTVSEGDAKIGIEEFRQRWEREKGTPIPSPLQ